MYERLTIPTENGYQADSLMAVERLGRLEDAIARIQTEYVQTLAALDKLAAQGKNKTATYQQLWANKMGLQEVLLRIGCL